jgi:hypothetical protein
MRWHVFHEGAQTPRLYPNDIEKQKMQVAEVAAELGQARSALKTLPVKADVRWREQVIRYSICTIVTRPDEYAEMVASFERGGFRDSECEFLYLDNTKGNIFESYSGYNLFLNVARGEYVILCHQDIVLMEVGRANLDTVLADLTRLDPNWAVCGNSGVQYAGRHAIRITDPYGVDQRLGEFPVRVKSLDENFIIVRRSKNLALSHDLQGFHLYGTDICIIAEMLGCSCYVVDFHLRHKSAGVRDTTFFAIRERMLRKYRISMRSRWVATPCTVLFLSGIPLMGRLLSGAWIADMVRIIGRRAPWLSRIVFRS